MHLKERIDPNKTPRHIAIIMDGNGRWAQKQGENRLFGHNLGVQSVREALNAAQEIGVEFLTLYAFSTENWSRPKEEVDGLMNLLVQTLGKEVDELHQSDVVIRTIGDIPGLPTFCQDELAAAYELTKNNQGIHLILALNYSSKWELTEATRKLALKVKNGDLTPAEVTQETISEQLCTSGIPDPELVIRTSGEYRVSNFLLWQSAYSEFYFTDILWPDFKKDDLFHAVIDYQSRQRRFGMTSEQITKTT